MPRTTKTKKENILKKTEAVLYGVDGKEKGNVTVPAELFGVQWNADLVHQVFVGMEANARPTVANTKFRGEVSGGGKKPWKQKGTGRARHGSTRSPIWKGGGTTHGPRAERVYAVKINKKMRRAALLSVLSRKYNDGEILFVEKLSYSAPKTADAMKTLKAIAKTSEKGTLITKPKNAAFIVFGSKDSNAEKSFRNVGNVAFGEARNLNVVDVLNRKFLIIENPEATFAVLSKKSA